MVLCRIRFLLPGFYLTTLPVDGVLRGKYMVRISRLSVWHQVDRNYNVVPGQVPQRSLFGRFRVL